MRKTIIVLGAALLLVTGAAPTEVGASLAPLGRERIRSFLSEVVIQTDGSMTVTETITVDALGDEIKRGIYRDFPTIYGGKPFSWRTQIPFDVVEVTRDGVREPYHTENLSNGIRVYFGEEGVFLDPGTYTYVLTYRTDKQLGYFDTHDELYWNVTGNDWAFPIDTATARIVLPPGVRKEIVEAVAFTGYEGDTGEDYRVSIAQSGMVEFITTRTLASQEGLTIAVRWPKGFVQEPTDEEKLKGGLAANMDSVVGGIGVLIVLLYYAVAWSRVGKDPKQGTIIPRYGPPENVSPAGARYLLRMGSDIRALTAAILSLAVKGAVTVHESEKKFLKEATYSISRAKPDEAALTPEEKRLYTRLLGNYRDTFEFKQSNHGVMKKARVFFDAALKKQFQKGAFRLNRQWFWPGVALSLLVVLGSGLAAGSVVTGDFSGPLILLPLGFVVLWASAWMVALFAIAKTVPERLTAFRSAKGFNRVGKTFGLAGMSLMGLFLIFPQAMALFFILELTSWVVAVAMLILVAVNVMFFFLLRAPTEEGRKLLDHIEGFKLFLSVTEKDRLNFHVPPNLPSGALAKEGAEAKGGMPEGDNEKVPERTVKLFEKYLPYAFALGVEHEWSQQFEDVLRRALEAGEPYAPMWYVGSNWDSFHTGAFASSLGSALSRAVSSASTAPGSSSGFSGGGSGGGGGGGGGGGW